MAQQLVETKSHIETPENVKLTFQLAGPALRMSAYVIDLIIRIAVVWGISFVVMMLFPIFGFTGLIGLPIGIVLVVMFLVEWGYGCFFEGFWNGRTPGKAAFRLRVIKQGGYPAGFYDAAIRNLLRAADILPIGYGIGLIVMASTERLQRIGDLVAGTVVIVEDRKRLQHKLPDLQYVARLPRVECQRRFHVSDRTLETIERLFDESRGLPSARIEQIAAILSGPIANHLGFHLRSMHVSQPHHQFLLRVLKTFASNADAFDDPFGDHDATRRGQRQPISARLRTPHPIDESSDIEEHPS